MDIKNKINAFSLIELIVWITISMMLMVSIWVFVSSWMKNIFLQQKSQELSSNLNDFTTDIYETFSTIQNSWSLHLTASWVIFKRNKTFSDWWFTYIWSSIINNYFCDDINSEDTNTNHIFIKNFIPFFENWEDINSNSILTWSVIHNWNTYISYQKEHKITDSSWTIIVWRWIFWDKFEDWDLATQIYINWPTWMASDWNKLYFSDTLNNRVLYLSWTTVHKLLDENDSIEEPTWLYYDSSNKALYISNSWLWEIIKISSPNILPPNKTFSFSWITENNVDTLYLEFYRDRVPHNINSLTINTSSFNNDTDDIKSYNNNIFSYSFMNWAATENKNFVWASTYSFDLSNLNFFLTSWVYTIKLIIWNTEKEFYYFTKWDDEISTMNDNKVEIVRTWIKYPNGIWWSLATESNEFNSALIWNLSPDINYDNILKNPINNLDISRNWGWNLLNLILKHYRNYNCYNLDENKEKINTFLSKIILK